MYTRLTTPPKRSPDGQLRMQYGVWRSKADFDLMTTTGYRRKRGDIRVRDNHGKVLFCRAANTHKMQIATTGERIIEVDGKWQLNDGRLIDPATLTARTQRQQDEIARIGFAKESFSRNVRAEADQHMGAWLNREQNRADSGQRDINGRKFMERFAGRTTLNLQVSASGDDGYGGSGSLDTSNVNILFGWLDAPYRGYAHFRNVPSIGALDSAVLTFVKSGGLSFFNGRSHLEKAASATIPVSGAELLSKAGTSAGVSINSSVSNGQKTHNLLAAMQEVQGSTGIGSSINALFSAVDTGNNFYILVTSYDGNSSLAPKLDIDYTAPLTGPDNLIAAQTDTNEITLTWDDLASSETGYEIQRESPTGDGFSTIDTIAANLETYIDGGLATGEYNYRVRAVGGGDPSDWSNESSVTMVTGANGGKSKRGLSFGF